MPEHYGVEVPIAAARQHTLAHAKAIGAVKHQPAPAASLVLTGLDLRSTLENARKVVWLMLAISLWMAQRPEVAPTSQ